MKDAQIFDPFSTILPCFPMKMLIKNEFSTFRRELLYSI